MLNALTDTRPGFAGQETKRRLLPEAWDALHEIEGWIDELNIRIGKLRGDLPELEEVEVLAERVGEQASRLGDFHDWLRYDFAADEDA